jgi:hypothetical protein
VRAVAAGDTPLAPPIARRLVESQLAGGARTALKARFDTLTERERGNWSCEGRRPANEKGRAPG